MVAAIGSAFFSASVVYAETIVFCITGTFSSVTMMWVLVVLVACTAMTLFKIVAMLVIVALASLLALVAMRYDSRWLNRVSLAVFGVASVVALTSWIPTAPPLPWTPTLVQITINPALFEGIVSPLHSGNVPALLEAYRGSARVSAHGPTVYTGQAKRL